MGREREREQERAKNLFYLLIHTASNGEGGWESGVRKCGLPISESEKEREIWK